MSKRTEQLGHEIQRILGEIIQYELKDPRVGFATVVGVEMTADLQIARVRVSVMGRRRNVGRRWRRSNARKDSCAVALPKS